MLSRFDMHIFNQHAHLSKRELAVPIEGSITIDLQSSHCRALKSLKAPLMPCICSEFARLYQRHPIATALLHALQFAACVYPVDHWSTAVDRCTSPQLIGDKLLVTVRSLCL